MKASRRDHRVYLQDILIAIQRIRDYTPHGEDDFFHSGVVQDAIIRQVSIIGEAASKLPSTVKAMRPDVPWKQIIGMRNIVIHDYSEINLGRMWATVERDLPTLEPMIQAMLADLSANDAA